MRADPQSAHIITHREVLARLDGAEKKRLLARSDRAGLERLAVHGGAAVLIGWLIGAQVPGWPFLLLIQGMLLVFLFAPLHETIHKTAFASDGLNRVVAAVCGFLLLIPPGWFRYFHFAHHRHTQDPERDPELAFPKPKTRRDYWLFLTGWPVWKGLAQALWRNALGYDGKNGQAEAFVPRGKRREICGEARLFLVLYGVLALFVVSGSGVGQILLWAWIVPVIVGQPFLRAFLLAEHALCPETSNMLVNTRTTFTHRLLRFLTWNMSFHIEHHALPAAPFHCLPRLHEHLRDHLGVTARGYQSFHRQYRASL
ncbi:MAG: fatty acid desaturase [Pseudomonadota bacterium]